MRRSHNEVAKDAKTRALPATQGRRRGEQEGTEAIARTSPATQSPQGLINVALSLRERTAELPTSVIAFERSSTD
jgi:hypothetical protein